MNLPTTPDITTTYIYNPTKEDFNYPFDRKNYTMPSMKISNFPKYLADHLAKHLAQKLALTESSKIHYEDRLNKWLEVIYVKI